MTNDRRDRSANVAAAPYIIIGSDANGKLYATKHPHRHHKLGDAVTESERLYAAHDRRFLVMGVVHRTKRSSVQNYVKVAIKSKKVGCIAMCDVLESNILNSITKE